MAVGLLFSINVSDCYYDIMLYSSIGVLGYIAIDCFLLWICKDSIDLSDEAEMSPSNLPEIERNKFNELLMSGELGKFKEMNKHV